MPLVDIPGVGQVEFPDSMSVDEIRAAAARLHGAPPEQKQSPITTGTRSALAGYLDNFLNIPNVIATTAQDALPESPSEKLQGFRELRSHVQGGGRLQDFPVERPDNRTRDILPLPDSNDVFSIADILGQAAGAVGTGDIPIGGFADGLPATGIAPQGRSSISTLEEAKLRQSELTRLGEEQNPTAHTVGEISGDAATLLTGRFGGANAIRSARDVRVAQRAVETARRSESLPFGVKRYVTGVFENLDSNGVKAILSRAGEAGFEGAVLSILQDGDPIEVGAYSAGGQLAGSTVLSLMPTSAKNTVKFGAAIAGVTALARFGQEFSPGENNIFTATDVAFEKAKVALLLGIASGAAGAGRIRSGGFADNFPVLAESITQIPRGATISLINRMVSEKEDGGNTTETILNKLSTDPDYFGENIRNRLDRAIRNNTIGEELDRLMQNDSFVQRLSEIE